MERAPKVSLVIPNMNGARHLPACLDSVTALDHPREEFETLVVDNGSSDGSPKLVAERYPWVRLLPQEVNVGFAEAVNLGAGAATGECLALVNNDMRLDPAWLSELLGTYEPDGGYPCVAGAILDWEGEHVDFVGGFVNLHGFAGQEAFGQPVADVEIEDGRELPFPCGASMLVERKLFLELGGFDSAFFALLEDVDFGWRLRLAGHGVRLAAGARSFHRHGATTGALPEDERLFLFERNALLMLLKNLDEANLGRFVAVALFLLAERAALDWRNSRPTTPPGIRAVDDVLDRLDSVLEERARVQRLRRRSDREVLAALGRPFLAVHGDERYLHAAALLARLFALDEIVEERGPQGERPATEETRQLLALWREQYGVGRSAWWHARRALALALPDPARRALRRLRRA